MLEELTDDRKNIFNVSDSLTEENQSRDSPLRKCQRKSLSRADKKIFSFGDTLENGADSNPFSGDKRTDLVVEPDSSDKKLKRKTSFVNFRSNSKSSFETSARDQATQTERSGLMQNELEALSEASESLRKQNRYLVGKLEKQRISLEKKYFSEKVGLENQILCLENTIEREIKGEGSELQSPKGAAGDLTLVEALYSICLDCVGGIDH